MFKKIKDERIQLKNLRHIRILFMIQSLGILTILIYDLVTGGFEKMMSNPLWYVFMITLIVSGYLSMNISVNYEPENKSPKRKIGRASCRERVEMTKDAREMERKEARVRA